jgi:integrase/recombinase XerD
MKVAEPVYDDNRAMEREDIDKLLGVITMRSKNPFILRRDTLIISILLFAGLRKGELLGLQLKDIDMDKRVLTVRGETSKSKRTRRLPINPTLLMHLQEYIRERNKKGYKTEYLIASDNEDKQLTAHGMKHWVNRLSRLSGVKFHLHRFRHSFVTELTKNNVNVVKLQKLLGHSDLRMTQRYVRSLSVEDLRDDVDRLGY